MRKRSNHVVFSRSGGWAVKKMGSRRSSRVFKTKEEAKSYGDRLSRDEGTELYIHALDGTVLTRSSYRRSRPSVIDS